MNRDVFANESANRRFTFWVKPASEDDCCHCVVNVDIRWRRFHTAHYPPIFPLITPIHTLEEILGLPTTLKVM
jgi:hypothetical protein